MEVSFKILNASKNRIDNKIIKNIKNAIIYNLNLTTNLDKINNYDLIIIDLDRSYDMAYKLSLCNIDLNIVGLYSKYLNKYKSLLTFKLVDLIERNEDIEIILNRINNLIYGMKNLYKTSYELPKVIEIMINALENKIEGICGHSRNVAYLTNLLLNEINKNDANLSDNDITLITEASIFHDIGKIYMPQRILNKPTKLELDEYSLIKSHTLLGAALIKRHFNIYDSKLGKYSYEICRWHHERYDGSGYPDKLVGDDIPLSAQVVAVADAYDALLSKRAYKEKIKPNEALSMIINGECGLFNPKIMKALINIQGI